MVTDTCYTLGSGGTDALMPSVEMLPQNSPHRQSRAAKRQRSNSAANIVVIVVILVVVVGVLGLGR